MRAAGLGHGSGAAGEDGWFTGPFVLWTVRCANSYCFNKIPDKSHFWTFLCGSRFERTARRAEEGMMAFLMAIMRKELGGSCLHPTLGIRERALALCSFLSV